MPLVTSTRSPSPTPSDPGRVGRADVVEAAIARAEAVNPALNALAYAAFDVARDAAAMGTGQEAFFSGVPTFIKDNVDVAGQPSMHGTDAWEPYAAVADSEITRVVLGTGLVSLGKTQLSEFGFSAVAEHPRLGPVRNPWNTDYTAGASSSGSGALVAAGVVPIAHANDGGGSICIPAACNGVGRARRRAAGCRWSRSIAGCRWASSPMAS